MKVLFYPKKLVPGQKLWYYLRHLGVEWTNDINDDDITIAVHTDYKNSNSLSEEMEKKRSIAGIRIINEHCNNVKKDHVDSVFTDVFGYSSFVDPTTHYGCCVIKSTQQAIHNGRIIECPIHPNDVDLRIRRSVTGEIHKRVYQKLIDTRFEKDKLREIRIPIINGNIPLLFIKELGVLNTFHPYPENHYKVYVDYDIGRWIKPDEVSKILEFTVQVGLEFGELDFLRDNSTGLGYIVDINNIPMGSLFSHLPNEDEIVGYLSNMFYNEFLKELK